MRPVHRTSQKQLIRRLSYCVKGQTSPSRLHVLIEEVKRERILPVWSSGRTPSCLHESILTQAPLSVVRALVEAWPELLLKKNDRDELPLHLMLNFSVGRDNGELFYILQTMVELAPETLRYKDSDGWLPLHFACFNANEIGPEPLAFLLRQYPTSLMEGCDLAFCPLYFLLRRLNSNKKNIILHLLHHVPDAFSIGNEHGVTPLHLVCDSPSLASGELLCAIAHRFPRQLQAHDVDMKIPLDNLFLETGSEREQVVALMCNMLFDQVLTDIPRLHFCLLHSHSITTLARLSKIFPNSLSECYEGRMPAHRLLTRIKAPAAGYVELLEDWLRREPVAAQTPLPASFGYQWLLHALINAPIALNMDNQAASNCIAVVAEQYPEAVILPNRNGLYPALQLASQSGTIDAIWRLLRVEPQLISNAATFR